MKLFVVLVGLVSSEQCRDFYLLKTDHETKRLRLWLGYLQSEHLKFQQRLSKEGTSADPEQVAYPNPVAFVNAMRLSYLKGMFS